MYLRASLVAILMASGVSGASSAIAHETNAGSIPGVSAEVLTRTDKSWNGNTLPLYPTGQPQVTIIRYQFAPDAVLPVHKHPVINAGVMLRGELRVKTTNGETLTLKAGDPIVELVNQWHEGRNTGKETAELIVFYAGTPDLPLVIRQSPEGQPPAAARSEQMPVQIAGTSVPFISGGVGDESMVAITAREKAFDLKLFLVGQSGSYLSDVRITITDQAGTGVLLTTSEGPVLLANLPSGVYTIKAQKNGQTKEQKVVVTRGKLTTSYIRFSDE